MPSPVVQAFSISHAAILNGSTSAGEQDIYGVRTGSLEPDIDSYTNSGDDNIQSIWNWFNFAALTIESGYITFDALAAISASAVTSSGSAPSDYWSIPIWSASSLNLPSLPVLIRSTGRKSTGEYGFLEFILYKVQFDPIKLDGMSYKNGLMISFTGKCLISDKDELGNSLTDPAVGRLRFGTRSIVLPGLQVIDNGDGTFTITGLGVSNNGDGTYTISSDQVTDNGDGSYTITY